MVSDWSQGNMSFGVVNNGLECSNCLWSIYVHLQPLCQIAFGVFFGRLQRRGRPKRQRGRTPQVPSYNINHMLSYGDWWSLSETRMSNNCNMNANNYIPTRSQDITVYFVLDTCPFIQLWLNSGWCEQSSESQPNQPSEPNFHPNQPNRTTTN